MSNKSFFVCFQFKYHWGMSPVCRMATRLPAGNCATVSLVGYSLFNYIYSNVVHVILYSNVVHACDFNSACDFNPIVDEK